jgi:hypothetical protein
MSNKTDTSFKIIPLNSTKSPNNQQIKEWNSMVSGEHNLELHPIKSAWF